MMLVGEAGRLYTNSMGVLGNAGVGDGLNAGITTNIEELRDQFANRFLISTTGAYAPSESSDLGADFLSTLGLNDQDGDPSNGIQTTEPIAQRSIQRSLKAIGNAVEVSYSHAGETVLTTRLLSPAAGWLP